jgi:hypothetical protein
VILRFLVIDDHHCVNFPFINKQNDVGFQRPCKSILLLNTKEIAKALVLYQIVVTEGIQVCRCLAREGRNTIIVRYK